MRNWTHVLDFALAPMIVVSFISGWFASLSGLTEFGLHKYSSIAFMLIAAGHLYMHWRMFRVHGRSLATKGAGAMEDVDDAQVRMFPPSSPANWGRVAFVIVVAAVLIVILSHPAAAGQPLFGR